MKFELSVKEEHVNLVIKFLTKLGYKVYCKNGKDYWR